MQFTPKHLTRIREIWEAFSQAYNSYSEESPGSKVMGPDGFVVAASQLMEEARREALKESHGTNPRVATFGTADEIIGMVAALNDRVK